MVAHAVVAGEVDWPDGLVVERADLVLLATTVAAVDVPLAVVVGVIVAVIEVVVGGMVVVMEVVVVVGSGCGGWKWLW